MTKVHVNTVLATPRCLARSSGLTSCVQSASCRPVTNRFSCCMTPLDTSTARLRDSWDVRQVVQNRSFTRRADDCGDCCKGNKGEQKSVSPPRRAEIWRAPKQAETLPNVAAEALQVNSFGSRTLGFWSRADLDPPGGFFCS